MSKNQNISGVAGWLGFLIIGLMVLGPIVGFGRLSGEFREAAEKYPQLAYSPEWKAYVNVSWLIFSAAAAMSFSAGYRLWKIHEVASVRFAIFILWLAGPLSNVLYVLAAAAIFGTNADGNAFAEMIGGVVGSCIVAGIWTTYLKRSHRVKNTYSVKISLPPRDDLAESPSSLEKKKENWWRSRSKGFRLWCFVSVIWAAAVFLFVLGFDPYGNGSWSYMDDDEYFRMFFVMLVPPLFFGAAKYAYDRWVG